MSTPTPNPYGAPQVAPYWDPLPVVTPTEGTEYPVYWGPPATVSPTTGALVQAPAAYGAPYAPPYPGPYPQPYPQRYPETYPRPYGAGPAGYAAPPPYPGFDLGPPVEVGAYERWLQDRGNLPAPRKRRVGWWIGGAIVLAGAVVLALVGPSSTNGTSSNPVAVPAGPGVVFQYPEGHFAARFPELPDKKTVPESVASLQITLHIAADLQSMTAIETVDFSASLASEDEDSFAHGALQGAGLSADVTVSGEEETTFQGYDARQATLTDSDTGGSSMAIIVEYSSTRMYVLTAPVGTPFYNLTTSFVVIP